MTTSPERRAVDVEPIVNLGAHLRDARLAVGLSLRELARQLGVSPSFVSQIENGKSQPSVATLYSLSQLLEVSIDRLFLPDGPASALDLAGHSGEPQETDESTQESETALQDTDAAVEDAENAPLARSGGREPRDDALLTRRDPGLNQGTANPTDDGLKQSETRSRLAVTSPGSRARLVMDSGVIWEQLATNTGPNFDFIEVIYPPGSDSTSDGRTLRHEGYEYGYLVAGELQATVGFDTFVLRAGEALGFNSSVPHRFTNVGTTPARGIWFVQHLPE
jgi:transcriptional regulator with XRE-family HTH domain/quercetin dioxygenase-like cupin family protein